MPNEAESLLNEWRLIRTQSDELHLRAMQAHRDVNLKLMTFYIDRHEALLNQAEKIRDRLAELAE